MIQTENGFILTPEEMRKITILANYFEVAPSKLLEDFIKVEYNDLTKDPETFRKWMGYTVEQAERTK